jgi:hypothetical protein
MDLLDRNKNMVHGSKFKLDLAREEPVGPAWGASAQDVRYRVPVARGVPGGGHAG